MTPEAPTIISAQPGPQSQFLETEADIAVFGGGAGGGKSYALLIEPLRHFENPKFAGVIFRRNATQVRNPGGLLDESYGIYPLLGGKCKDIALEWSFPRGMTMRFAHLEYDKTVLDWQGSQIPYIGLDELTHFTAKQFWYMLSRNRSSSGVRGYVRATCNPEADGWVRELLDWWIGPDGLPIKERSGVLRWFIRQGEELIWANSKEELIAQYGEGVMPKSLTFISARLFDNKILMENDPAYHANLLALDRVERARLLDGNWNVRPSSGSYFRRSWFEILDRMPDECVKSIRYWDRAATKPSETNRDPDWTVGVLLVKTSTNYWVVQDVRRLRDSPLKVEEFMRDTAAMDGVSTTIWLEQDPGSAGVADISNLTRLLQGYMIKVAKPTKDKVTRAGPVSAQVEQGNIKILKGAWNNDFISECENFPEGKHDDQVDGLSGAFNAMLTKASVFDSL